MTGDRPNNLDDALVGLRLKYLSSLDQRLKEIQRIFNRLIKNPWDFKLLSTLQLHAHNLAGSGGTFGFNEISQKARDLDIYLKDRLLSNATLQQNHFETMTSQIIKLQKACSEAVELKNSEEFLSTTSTTLNVLRDKPSLLILANCEQKAQELCGQINSFDYQIKLQRFDEIQSQQDVSYLSESPYIDAIVVIREKGDDVAQTLSHVNSALPLPRPMIFISDLGDIDVRLNATRLGSDAFFMQPVEITQLIDQLDRCTRRGKYEAFRVLIVDDCETLAQTYAIFLNRANIETRIITNPMLTLDAIVEFQPELILMDMYMPECTGSELAKVIRQQNSYDSVPIVFLSAESDLSKQLDALSLGGDDFLTKPISAKHLVTAVRIRSERYRELRSHMTKDGLTGLYNHTRTEEQLMLELSRAGRLGQSLSYVMIDVDHFKSVNDNHGHAVGDQVLKLLARLLTQSLRKTDIIGRYGGEEFTVVLANTDAASALKVIDKIRIAFNQIVHKSGIGHFSVSFSAGIAEYPFYDSAKSLHEAADNALYECKNAGRNRILIANHSRNVA